MSLKVNGSNVHQGCHVVPVWDTAKWESCNQILCMKSRIVTTHNLRLTLYLSNVAHDFATMLEEILQTCMYSSYNATICSNERLLCKTVLTVCRGNSMAVSCSIELWRYGLFQIDWNFRREQIDGFGVWETFSTHTTLLLVQFWYPYCHTCKVVLFWNARECGCLPFRI